MPFFDLTGKVECYRLVLYVYFGVIIVGQQVEMQASEIEFVRSSGDLASNVARFAGRDVESKVRRRVQSQS